MVNGTVAGTAISLELHFINSVGEFGTFAETERVGPEKVHVDEPRNSMSLEFEVMVLKVCHCATCFLRPFLSVLPEWNAASLDADFASDPRGTLPPTNSGPMLHWRSWNCKVQIVAPLRAVIGEFVTAHAKAILDCRRLATRYMPAIPPLHRHLLRVQHGERRKWSLQASPCPL